MIVGNAHTHGAQLTRGGVALIRFQMTDCFHGEIAGLFFFSFFFVHGCRSSAYAAKQKRVPTGESHAANQTTALISFSFSLLKSAVDDCVTVNVSRVKPSASDSAADTGWGKSH